MRYILAVLLFATASVWAQPMGGDGRIIKMLKLTDDQQKQFDKVQSDFQKKQIDLRSKIETMRVDLRELLRADEPDQAKIESKMTEISKVQNDMKLASVAHWFSVNKMLTPEQQKTWKEHRQMMAMDGPGTIGERLRGFWDRMRQGHSRQHERGGEKE